MKIILRIGLVVLLVALGAGGYWFYKTRLAPKSATTTTTS